MIIKCASLTKRFISIHDIITKSIVFVNEMPIYTILTTHFFQKLGKKSICIKKTQQKTPTKNPGSRQLM